MTLYMHTHQAAGILCCNIVLAALVHSGIGARAHLPQAHAESDEVKGNENKLLLCQVQLSTIRVPLKLLIHPSN